MKIIKKIANAAILSSAPSVVFAQETAELSGANTAWILTSTALVLFMTLPGLSLFYGGLVRTKNVLSVLMQCFAIAAVISVLWLIVGYSIAFGPSESAYWGGLSKALFSGITVDSLAGDIPESVFATFQMTFAIITPALMVGAFVERIKFSSMLLFSTLWTLLVYFPVANWVWGGGWLQQMGDRLRGRHGRACHGRRRRTRHGSLSRPSHGLSHCTNDAAQPDNEFHRRRHALGGLVRIQCR